MDRAETEKILLEALHVSLNAEGWANLSQIGARLREKNVKYGKLVKFLHSYSNVVDIRIDETVTPPAVYARPKQAE